MTRKELKRILAGHLVWLRGEDGTRADLRDADLRDADLRDADLRDADLRDAVLTGAVLTGAVLRDAVLTGAVLTGADLRGADLRGADLTGADLRGADLRGADLRGADLRGASPLPLPADASRALRAEVAAQIRDYPETHVQRQWHCETGHCVAGWAIVKAGHLGAYLESQLGTATAAALLLGAGGKIPSFMPDTTREEILSVLES